MLIRRCAWHREAHGYTRLHGIASWRGLSVKFTDGVCRQCAARVRVEWHLGRAPSASPFSPAGLAPGRYRYVAVVAGFVLLAAAGVTASGPRLAARSGPPSPVAQTAAGLAPPPVTAAPLPPITEAEPPRVSRHRPPPPDAIVIRRRFPPPISAPIASSVPAPIAPRSPESRRIEPLRPVQAAARLLLAPTEERPRHAGTVVQTP